MVSASVAFLQDGDTILAPQITEFKFLVPLMRISQWVRLPIFGRQAHWLGTFHLAAGPAALLAYDRIF